MKKTLKRTLAVLLALTLLSLTACGNAGGAASPANSDGTAAPGGSFAGTMKFSILGPMTGDSSEQGLQMVNGAKMAVDEINAAGGLNGYELTYEVLDTQAIPDVAITCAEKVAAGNSEWVISPIMSGCTIAIEDVLEPIGMPVLSSNNTRDDLCQNGWTNFVRIIPPDANLSYTLTDTAIAMGATSIGILYANTANDSSNKDMITNYLKDKYGMDVTIAETFSAEADRDFTSILTKFNAAGVDCIYTCSEYSPAAMIFTQMDSLGYDFIKIGSGGCTNPEFIQLAGESAEGVVTGCGFDPSNPDPNVVEWVAEYKKLFNKDPSDQAALTYELVNCIAQAYKEGATHETLIETLKGDFVYHGGLYSADFDEIGENSLAKHFLLQIEDGQYKSYIPEKKAS